MTRFNEKEVNDQDYSVNTCLVTIKGIWDGRSESAKNNELFRSHIFQPARNKYTDHPTYVICSLKGNASDI